MPLSLPRVGAFYHVEILGFTCETKVNLLCTSESRDGRKLRAYMHEVSFHLITSVNLQQSDSEV